MATFNIFCLGTSHSTQEDDHLIINLFNNTCAFDLNNVIRGQDVIKETDRQGIASSTIQKEAQSVINDLKQEFPDAKIQGEFSSDKLVIRENNVPVLELTRPDLEDRILFKAKPELKSEILSAVKSAEEQNKNAPIKLIADGLAPKLHDDSQRAAQAKTLPLQAMYGLALSDRAKGICELIMAGGPPDKVHLIGHGRGAVLCIQIAYNLSESVMGAGKAVPCHLCLADPVKQRLDPDPMSYKSLYMNVDIDSFCCIFMEDADEKCYPMMNIRLGEYPDAYLTANRPNLFIRLPGGHATVSQIAGYNEKNPNQYPLQALPGENILSPPSCWPIGQTALQMITRWQNQRGVSQVSPVQATDKIICESLFQINRTNPLFYRTTSSKPAQDSLARLVNDGTGISWVNTCGRNLALNKAGLVNPYRFSSGGFIDPHHILMFKKAWPGLYQALFTRDPSGTAMEELLVENQPYTKFFYAQMKQEKDRVNFALPGWLA